MKYEVQRAAFDTTFVITAVDNGLVEDLGTLVRVPKLVGNVLLFHKLVFSVRAFGAENAAAVDRSCVARRAWFAGGGRARCYYPVCGGRRAEGPLLGLNGSLRMRSNIRAFFFASSADEC